MDHLNDRLLYYHSAELAFWSGITATLTELALLAAILVVVLANGG